MATNELTDEEIDQHHLRRQGELKPSRKDLFAASAPPMPAWWLIEYKARSKEFATIDEYRNASPEAQLVIKKQENIARLDAEVQWRWEFAERMIRLEHERK